MKFVKGIFVIIILFITACSAGEKIPAPSRPTETAIVQFQEPTSIPSPTKPSSGSPTPVSEKTATQPLVDPTVIIQATEGPRRDPLHWQDWPIVPVSTYTAKEIYLSGITQGKNPQSFIKIGDCETYSTWFLADFDTDNYTLGDDYQSLSGVIDHFQGGSFSRLSVAAKAGFNAASVISPFWADREVCEANETPLACEIRIMQPSLALVTLGSNDVWQPDKFEANYRAILDVLIAEGVVPILATKADNIEGDHSINLKIAEIAVEYDLPVWNFWASVQDLPDQGLQEDGVHLTWAPNRFDDPAVMLNAWPVRNLTALMVLDSIWRGVTE